MDWITQEFAASDGAAVLAARRSRSLAALLPAFVEQLHRDCRQAVDIANQQLTAHGKPYVVQCDPVNDGVQLLHHAVRDIYIVQVRGVTAFAGTIAGIDEKLRTNATFRLEPSGDYSELRAHSADGAVISQSEAIRKLLLPFFKAVIAH